MPSTRDFARIESAIRFILDHSSQQPSLDTIAAHLHLSQHHLHRMFVRHTGITPKQFLHVLNIEQAKKTLRQQRSVMQSALTAGLSGSSRLHDQFITIEAVSPGEFKSLGKGMRFSWGHCASVFGEALVVWTERGIHRLEFISGQSREDSLNMLSRLWPLASFSENQKQANTLIKQIFHGELQHLNLWIQGSNFQVNVWKALLTIPSGAVAAYGDVAAWIGKPRASRAVGSAIGANPVAFLIPCHRVIQTSGALSQYRWQAWRKGMILATELGRELDLEPEPKLGSEELARELKPALDKARFPAAP